jgi:hypothetical protein
MGTLAILYFSETIKHVGDGNQAAVCRVLYYSHPGNDSLLDATDGGS